MMAKILAFAGSARKDSLNKKLLKIVATGAEAAGAQNCFFSHFQLALVRTRTKFRNAFE
jgi:NAD(P)H-dependent FMN reductase